MSTQNHNYNPIYPQRRGLTAKLMLMLDYTANEEPNGKRRSFSLRRCITDHSPRYPLLVIQKIPVFTTCFGLDRLRTSHTLLCFPSSLPKTRASTLPNSLMILRFAVLSSGCGSILDLQHRFPIQLPSGTCSHNSRRALGPRHSSTRASRTLSNSSFGTLRNS